MKDILSDYREWRDQQAARASTHSDGCHMWHKDCMIHRLADALAVANAQREWVSVSERLPVIALEVLVFFRALDKDGTPACCGCDGHGGMIDLAFLETIEGELIWTGGCGMAIADSAGAPTHWMPLPEPPTNCKTP